MSNFVLKALADDSFDELRKLIAVNLVGEGITPKTAAVLADKSANEAQAKYDVGSGKCSEQDAIENLIDRETARVSVWFQENGAELCEKGCMIAATFVGTMLTPYFGPKAAEVCKTVGKTLGKSIGVFGTKVIDEGTRKIAAYAKKWYNKGKEVVMNFAKEKLSKIFN